MKTLYLRITVALALALVCALVALWEVSASIARRMTGEFFESSMTLELQQAQRSYEEGGPKSVVNVLAETDAALRGKRFFTDANGRDLVSGQDFSNLRSNRLNFFGFPEKNAKGQFVIVKPSADGRYRLVVIAPPPMGLSRFVPYFLLLAVAVAVLVWALSAGIISPLCRLANAVERFGQGDFSARVASERKDEIGNLARSFNIMADRIENLLTAEKRLLQDVSHELRSPLARLSFAAELVNNSPDPEAATNRLRREIKRLSSLVSTLLEFTSAEGDPASRRRNPVVLTSLIDEIVDDCLLEAETRGVHIHGPSCHVSSTVEGDAELLRRAVENLLRNAIRFAPSGSAVVIEMEAISESTVLRVRDYGPGVPDAILGRIFEPFFRADVSKDGATNSGLGLSIARRAVLLHGGNIRAENANPGLMVTISLPYLST